MSNKYGWIPDVPDQRDFKFAGIKYAAVPDFVDLKSNFSGVEDQGNLGSCTANAGVGVYEYLENKQALMKYREMSRLFLYYNTRILEGTVKEDSGASIRNTIKALAKWGVCSEKSWPYIVEKFRKKPNSDSYEKAAVHKIITYERISTLESMIQCLADGYPFIFGFGVYESFESEEVKRSGIVNMPLPQERLLGGHAVVAVGYDKKYRRFIVRNSWGKDWGMDGYFSMPFEYLADRDLSDDFWVVRKEN